ncbi:hypothetical protein DKX38_029961 [Salix brachista]|uniref:Uncharacterized protein n=1 Tax=Salix brachista TaxID=2182728 RepID=A0A5N5J634_9ROSI|nr:hypothetical protein DKX38_029961 [Salix brachista]
MPTAMSSTTATFVDHPMLVELDELNDGTCMQHLVDYHDDEVVGLDKISKLLNTYTQVIVVSKMASTTTGKPQSDRVLFTVLAFICLQEDGNPMDDGASIETDQPANPSLQRMPKKQTLEFILDILQRRDTQEIFAQPVDPDEVGNRFFFAVYTELKQLALFPSTMMLTVFASMKGNAPNTASSFPLQSFSALCLPFSTGSEAYSFILC